MEASGYRQLAPGEPAPWFRQRTTAKPDYVFDTTGGRYIVLCFLGTARDAAGQAALGFAQEHRALFDDERCSFFGVTSDPDDAAAGRVVQSVPGIRHFLDFDGAVARLYGALPEGAQPGDDAVTHQYRRIWVVLNPGLQVKAVLPFRPDGSDRQALATLLEGLPPVSHYGGLEMHAPVIIIPDVLESALCEDLVRRYEAAGGTPSGFMRDVDGKTVALHDPGHKRRSDYTIEDDALRRLLQHRVRQKVVPVIRKVHCFEANRMERYLVGCYDAESGGHFAPHRDNTTRGTAHRRFALSVNLNDDFEGGELAFPEYGWRRYKVPAGGAIVFAGALLHTVSAVRRGRRYAFLPFLYDDAAAAEREANSAYLAGGGGYKAWPGGVPPRK
ncbi:MAG TPA: 2OG-Fe(II) oxygenase [Ramlibacter sp.]|uniref:2OG-Fe(II) oxygenase n=1 Tax=Ramlibacter sp. TaxID=1917967 RepID=UPI002D7F9347|nr:2OG-Fe(II) oxygenase [Ramlibacter sp.]HET8748529.1 2OG-Fe(II) oxygenase [Ramlibacter sp.]